MTPIKTPWCIYKFLHCFVFILMQVNESLQLVGKNVINPAALETGDDDHMLGRDLFHLQ